VLGAAAGYFLVPKEKEMALIKYKEQVYDFDKDAYASKDAYRRRFDEGDHSVDVVNALVDIYLQEGAVDEAIVVLEAYVNDHPNNIPARKQLGTLYQYAQRPADYLRNLEKIRDISGDDDVLRGLSDIYSFNEEYGKQAEVMGQLISTKDKPLEAAQYLDLANLQASEKKPKDAIKTLSALKKAYPDAVPYDAQRLLVSLLLDEGDKEAAIAEAISWKTRAASDEELAQLSNLLHYKGEVALADKYMASFDADKISKSPVLLAELTQIYLAQGKDQEAFQVLEGLRASGTLSDELIDSYLMLALRYKNDELVEELMARVSPEVIAEPQAISLVEVARSSGRGGLLEQVSERLGTPEYLQAHPLFALVLGLASHEEGISEKVAAFLDATEMTGPQRIMLARACTGAGDMPCAERLIAELKQGEIDAARVAAVGTLYLDIRNYEDGLAFVEQYRAVHSSADVETVWVKLAAATGKDAEVVDWMAKNEGLLSEGLLTNLFFLAGDIGHDPLAMDAAKMLNERVNTPETRNYLAHAYMKNGQFEEALALLREADELTDEMVDAYLASLIKQAKKDPSYRDELAKFASEQFSSGSMSERRKLALVYALIDGGRADIAMPYIRQFALRSGGDWAYIYAENLNKMGKYEEARQFWLMAARRPGVKPGEKRSIAFALLESGYRGDALGLFTDLAQNAAPGSADVNQLLYIWGPRLEHEHLDWLYARAARTNDPAEKSAWLKLIVDSAGADGIEYLADAHPEALQNKEVLTTYLEAKYGKRDEKALDAMLEGIRKGAYGADVPREYARFARDYGMPQRSVAAYKMLLAVNKNDEEALREVGTQSFGAADYSEAKDHLGNYLMLRKESAAEAAPDAQAYLAYFYYAEMLRREGEKKEAARYYRATVDVVGAEHVPTADMESKRQQSRIYLGAVKEGTQGFQEAVTRFPDDSVLRADYATTLVELKRYEEARGVMKSPAPTMQASALAAEPLEISEREFPSWRLTADRRELLLAYNPRTTPKPSISEKSPLAYAWMGYVTQGYDQVLVSAKPNYTLEVVRKQGGGISVVPREDAARSAHAPGRQEKLRYELLNARIDLETGKQHAAAEQLNGLLKEFPRDSQVLGYTANAENYVGRWQRALRLLREASALAPENEDIEVLKHDIERLHAQHVKLDHEWRALGDHDEHITTLSGFHTVSEGTDVGIEVQNNHLNSDTLRRADGRIARFKDDKQRGEFFVRHTEEEGRTWKASLFANNDTAGAGGYFDWVNRLGISGASIEFHRPYWEFVEGVLDDATRDRAELRHAARINEKMTVELDASLNRYNVDSEENVASGVGVGGTVAYQLLDDPYLAVIYGVDAEYELDHEDRVDGTGTAYRPFPFRSREVHSLALSGTYRFTRRTYLDYTGGYGVDRLGGHGPVGEARLTHELTDKTEVQGRAAYGIGAGETDEDISRVGVYLLHRY
jgi:predicted Zn-dependent protease